MVGSSWCMVLCVSQGRNLTAGQMGWFPCQKVQPYVFVSMIQQPAWLRKYTCTYMCVFAWTCTLPLPQNHRPTWTFVVILPFPEANPRPVLLQLVSVNGNKIESWIDWATVSLRVWFLPVLQFPQNYRGHTTELTQKVTLTTATKRESDKVFVESACSL